MIQLNPQNISFYDKYLKTSIPFTSQKDPINLFKYDYLINQLPSKDAPNGEILTIIDTLYKRLKDNEKLEINDCLECLCEYNHHHKIVFTKKVQLDNNTYVLFGINNNIQTWDSNGEEITASEAYIQTVKTNLHPASCSEIYIATKEMPSKPLRIFGKEITIFQDHQSKLITLAQEICNKKD